MERWSKEGGEEDELKVVRRVALEIVGNRIHPWEVLSVVQQAMAVMEVMMNG